MGGDFTPGRGIDMTNPDDPKLSPLRAFHHTVPTDVQLGAHVNDIVGAVVTFHEAQSDYEEARLLNTYFHASYLFASFDAALQTAHSDRAHSRSIYVLIEKSGDTDELDPTEIRWSTAPAAESLSDENDRYNQFIEDYGSHYILSVQYGMRVAIRATLNTTNESRFEAFSGAIHAAFGLIGSAGGSVSAEAESKLSAFDFRIDAEIMGRSSDNSIVLTGFPQVADWLSRFASGSVSVKEVPISCHIMSYHHTLLKYPKCRAMLAPAREFTKPVADFGVPAGTILPWRPGPAALQIVASGERVIVPPEGWEICDGRSGTPDLRDRFIMGTASASDLLKLGGHKTHHHTGVTGRAIDAGGTFDANNFADGSANHVAAGTLHTHPFTTSEESNLPPYVELIYIMKL